MIQNPHDGYVQVAPNSSGAQVRNITVIYIDPADGSTQSTRYQQVVAIARADGSLIDPSFDAAIMELRSIREMLELALAGLKLR